MNKNMGKKSSAKKAKKEISEELVSEAVKEVPKKTVLEQPEKIISETPAPQEPRMREIIIQTNGHDIKITKNETVGSLELSAILQALLGSLTSSKR